MDIADALGSTPDAARQAFGLFEPLEVRLGDGSQFHSGMLLEHPQVEKLGNPPATYQADSDGGGVPRFGYAKADRRVTAYYFYLVDEAFGPAFVKVCAYFPYPIKIWLSGHEYTKRAATAARIAYTELDNGFATTDDPAGLQRICDTLGRAPSGCSANAGGHYLLRVDCRCDPLHLVLLILHVEILAHQ